jgi:hypothetical protein
VAAVADGEALVAADGAPKAMMLLPIPHLPTSMAAMPLLGALLPAAAAAAAAVVEDGEDVVDVAAMLPRLRSLQIRFRI